MEKARLKDFLSTTLQALPLDDAHAGGLFRGKVRDIVDLGDKLLITTTDRLSAFDRVLTTIPCKGQVLNELSLYWFEASRGIIRNHILEKLSPRSVLTLKCDVLPVEVVVRGYLTGSAWRDYRQGKAISGIVLPPHMRMNQKFDRPLITPTTKAERGTHDLPISSAEIVKRGLVPADLWRKVEEAALGLFRLGTETAANRGLMLVDTKYEFGILDGELLVIDEMHTPDSSRYWYADTYDELFAQGAQQRELDKEYLRQWLIERGYMGDGQAPHIPDDIRLETGLRYVAAFEKLTGRAFVPGEQNEQDELRIVRETIDRHMTR